MSQPPKSVTSSRAPAPVGPYPHARRVGSLLFVSGIGPREPGTNQIPGLVVDDAGEIVRYDITLQCHSVFKNIAGVDKLAEKGCLVVETEVDGVRV